MKNKDIKDINGFKKRIKMLYEYRMVDLNTNDISVQVNEDETESQDNVQPTQPEQTTQTPQPVTPQQPVQPAQQTQAPEQVAPQQPKEEDNQVISYLKNEMGKLENIISSIEEISSNVENLGNRMDNISKNFTGLSKAVDEIREPSDIEKLEMRSFDSYPYNKTLNAVWEDKEKSKEEQELQKQGIRKTDDGYEMDYVPMQGMNYNKTDINQF